MSYYGDFCHRQSPPPQLLPSEPVLPAFPGASGVPGRRKRFLRRSICVVCLQLRAAAAAKTHPDQDWNMAATCLGIQGACLASTYRLPVDIPAVRRARERPADRSKRRRSASVWAAQVRSTHVFHNVPLAEATGPRKSWTCRVGGR